MDDEDAKIIMKNKVVGQMVMEGIIGDEIKMKRNKEQYRMKRR